MRLSLSAIHTNVHDSLLDSDMWFTAGQLSSDLVKGRFCRVSVKKGNLCCDVMTKPGHLSQLSITARIWRKGACWISQSTLTSIRFLMKMNGAALIQYPIHTINGAATLQAPYGQGCSCISLQQLPVSLYPVLLDYTRLWSGLVVILVCDIHEPSDCYGEWGVGSVFWVVLMPAQA